MIFPALLSRTLPSWLDNDFSEFNWVVAQVDLWGSWLERDIGVILGSRVSSYVFLCVTPQIHNNQLVAGLVQLRS